MGEVRVLHSEGREIRWILTRKKVKNVNLRVKPDGIVYVSAAARVPVKFIEGFILEKSSFIFSALERFSQRSKNPQSPSEENVPSDGSEIQIFDDKYKINVVFSQNKPYYKFNDYEIILYVNNSEQILPLTKKIYAEKTREIFESINASTCEMFRVKGYNIPLADLQIREMKSQWGSCHIAKGKIVMNSRLAFYPLICTKYVFIHEYAHFLVPNHSKSFYAVVARFMPDYKLCVGMLKR